MTLAPPRERATKWRRGVRWYMAEMKRYGKQAAFRQSGTQWSIITLLYLVHPLPLTRRSPQGEKRDCGTYPMASQRAKKGRAASP